MIGGYVLPFALMALNFLICVPIIYNKLPKDEVQEVDFTLTLPIKSFMTNKKCAFTLIILLWPCATNLMIDPNLALHLERYEIQTSYNGLYFAIECLSYMIGMLVLG